MTPTPRAILVDDHHMILESFRIALARHLDIVGCLGLGAEVLPAVQRLHPDIVLLDLGLPDRSGLEVISELHARCPACKVLVVTMHADRVLADAALQSGACGYIAKDAGITELLAAIAEVLDGRRFVSESIPRRPSHRADPTNPTFGFARLTPRQRQIVELLADGRSTAQIATALGVSSNTVTFHRVRIRKALGLKDEFELKRYAIVQRMSEASLKETPH